MNGYYLHINGSTLRLGLYDGTGPGRFLTEELLPTACSHSKIVDTEEFAKEFKKVLALHYGEYLPKLPLFFILEPEVTELFLLTDNKQAMGTEQEDQIMEKQIREKLVDESPENFYVTEYKIAPFIYQFVGVKKTILDNMFEFSRLVGLELGGIFPIALLLAKTNSEISSMFVFPKKDEISLIFSELTGVTFSEKLLGRLDLEGFKELFWKLSVYNTKNTELKIYSFAKYERSFPTQEPVNLLDQDLEEGYEEISLAQKLLRENQNLIFGQCNLVNIAPTPTTETRNRAPSIAVAVALSFVLIGGLILQLTLGFDSVLGKRRAGQNQEVLSEQKQTQVVAPKEQNPPIQDQSQQNQKPTQAKELKRSDLTIRVENGNGIPGSAGKMKSYLEGFGYKVLDPANADKINYEKTVVKLPKELSDYKNLIAGDLKTSYSVEFVEIENKNPDYDILIIVGRE